MPGLPGTLPMGKVEPAPADGSPVATFEVVGN
jgi:hypothetical protein